MGLLDQFKAYIDANTPRNTRPAVSPTNVIYAGLLQKPIENIKANAAGLLGEIQRAPQDLSALASPQMYAQALKAMNTPKPVDKQKWLDAGMELSGMAPIGMFGGMIKQTGTLGKNMLIPPEYAGMVKRGLGNVPDSPRWDAAGLLREDMGAQLRALESGDYLATYTPAWGAKGKPFYAVGDNPNELADFALSRIKRKDAAVSALSKYDAIPKHWKGDARNVAKSLIDNDVNISRFSSSTQSKSKYIELADGRKIRLSDHDLPLHYEGSDIDFRYGGDVADLLGKLK